MAHCFCLLDILVGCTDIVRHWRALESRAVSEQADCQQLYSLHVDRVHIARELEAFERSINISDDKFDDIQMLEMTLRAMQVLFLLAYSKWVTP